MNNIFEPKRFGKLMRLQFVLRWRKMSLVSGGFIALISVVYFLFNMSNLFNNGAANSIDIDYVYQAQLISTMFYCMLIVYICLMVFSPYFKRESAAEQLLIPATRFEKYTLSILYAIVIAPLALFSLMLLTDVVWIEIIKSTTGVETANISINGVQGFDPLSGLIVSICRMVVTSLDVSYIVSSLVISEVALMLLFATIYKRHTVLLSIISMGLVHTILITALSHTMLHCSETCAAVALNVATLALIYLSWRRFSRFQIIK